VLADIRERAEAEQIVAATLERHGRLDLVLNNTGGQHMVPAESLATKGWRAVHRPNVDGTLWRSAGSTPSRCAHTRLSCGGARS